MRRLLLWCLALLIGHLVPCRGGALFDDYLNPVREARNTGPGPERILLSPGSPLVWTLPVPSGTAEIYRLGLRPLCETWEPGESLTLALGDPETDRHLATSGVPWTTSGVQVVHGTDDRVLYFPVRCDVSALTSVRAVLSVSGPSAESGIAVQGFAGDDAGSPSVAFALDIKPSCDREANLRRFFSERLDTGHPGLEEVRAAVAGKEWERAILETVRHFHERMEIWDEWSMFFAPDPKETPDTTLADMVLNGSLQHVETGEPVPWRARSYWVPEYPTERESPKHAVEPSLYRWKLDRVLGAAYTDTADPVYARALIDLRMQFILDNPSPKRSALPHYHELWNDRTAAGRAPGHGTLPYARLYNYAGWTADEKLVLFAFMEDNAHWDFEATSGANWGAEAARACYEFGLRFPEWRLSREYVRWGLARLAQIVIRDVRGDGTSTEAAIKYHAMVARRLKGMLEDHFSGAVTLAPEVLGDLLRVLEGMYEHMAHTLQPDRRVVMCGDSWYEDYSSELLEVAGMVSRPDFAWFGSGGEQGEPPAQLSKVFPEAGYFIMRTDQVRGRLPYDQALQLFVHNGIWFGSHGHWDLNSINLYAFGRPLLIDPGQYDYEPPAGIDRYWQSRVHSMLVMNGADVKREAGPVEWCTSSVMDWYDGRHAGYRHFGDTPWARRRMAFVRPGYFLVVDSAETSAERDWAQVWNLSDPDARIAGNGQILDTTFADGGNLRVLNHHASRFRVEAMPGITAAGEVYPRTRIVRLHTRTADPRFVSLLVPYSGTEPPVVQWQALSLDAPGQAVSGDPSWAVQVLSGETRDWAVFGRSGTSLGPADGSLESDADFALVRSDARGQVQRFAWARGCSLRFGDDVLAASAQRVHTLAVRTDPDGRVHVEVSEPESSLLIRVRAGAALVLNGEPVEPPRIEDGYWRPFAALPRTLVADDADAFVRLTETDEWARVADPGSWQTGYTHHETDVGRHETGDYVLRVPADGRYAVEAFLPRVTKPASDRVEYRVPAPGTAVEVGGAVAAVRQGEDVAVLTLDQSSAAGWVRLGSFDLVAGELRVTVRNVTETDGLYLIADAVRLVHP